jgi:hypothetical protein
MASFLKIVSGVYLIFVWLAFSLTLKAAVPLAPALGGAEPVIAFLIAIGLSIPAVALFAFGQVVGGRPSDEKQHETAERSSSGDARIL